MNLANANAVVLFFGVTTYAVFGGADFGAGFWDLIAGGAKRGERPRAIIDHSIGPVWEANHVWLIFCLVVLWTAFAEAFASITLTLFVPLTLAAFGIVLRGSSFAFRKAVLRTRDRRNFGAAFALASVIVPYCMGSVAGAIASGRVPSGGEAGDPWSSWLNPTSITGGLLAIATCRVSLGGLPRVGCPSTRRTRSGGILPPSSHRRIGRHRRDRVRRNLCIARGCDIPLPRLDVEGVAVGHPLRGVRHRVARAARARRRAHRAAFLDRRGRNRGDRLGRRAMALHASHIAQGVTGRGTHGNSRSRARRLRGRGRHDPAGPRPCSTHSTRRAFSRQKVPTTRVGSTLLSSPTSNSAQIPASRGRSMFETGRAGVQTALGPALSPPSWTPLRMSAPGRADRKQSPGAHPAPSP